MAAMSLDPRLNVHSGKSQHGVILEEIEGLIRVYKNGHIERPPIVPNVTSAVRTELNLTSKDIIIDKCTNVWARFYVPNSPLRLPLLIYFHGGGFCVGSASWSCYHEFLSNLASKVGCMIMSVSYRLAPENRLPAAYEDGLNAVLWLKQQVMNGQSVHHLLSQYDLTSLFLAGDSAGANIAYNVAIRLESINLNPLFIKGIIMIQPFFGGEERTGSEKLMTQPVHSALTLPASDAYWRLSLPLGANRDHKWCNPFVKSDVKSGGLKIVHIMVCISEMDILKDRNLQFCTAMANAGKRVEAVVYKGVGHAFQVLHNSQLSQTRTHEMMSHIKTFISR